MMSICLTTVVYLLLVDNRGPYLFPPVFPVSVNPFNDNRKKKKTLLQVFLSISSCTKNSQINLKLMIFYKTGSLTTAAYLPYIPMEVSKIGDFIVQ